MSASSLILGIMAAAATQGAPPSALDRNAPTSDYRLLWLEDPSADGETSRPIRWARRMILVDAGNLRRNADGTKTMPIIFLRRSIDGQPDRDILVYHDMNVKCGVRVETGTPTYENLAGPIPLSADLQWRPDFEDESVVTAIAGIACTKGKPGGVIGRKTRAEIVTFLHAEPAAIDRSEEEPEEVIIGPGSSLKNRSRSSD